MSPIKFSTVVLANGVFPTHPVPLSALKTAGRIVCCDGAADRLTEAAGLAPEWIVGDLDSVSSATRTRYRDRLFCVKDQESNDLAKAFRFCLSHGWAEVAIVGATGLREDHTLGNLSLLVDFAREASVVLLTDTGCFRPLLTSGTLASFAGQQVSIFSFDPGTAVSAEGLRYPLDGLLLSRWWQAALNEASGDAFSLSFAGGPLLVFQTYPPPHEKVR